MPQTLTPREGALLYNAILFEADCRILFRIQFGIFVQTIDRAIPGNKLTILNLATLYWKSFYAELNEKERRVVPVSLMIK